MSNDKVIIFDTTLRDGEQAPGATMTASEKLKVAHALARLGVDVIEPGFPLSSEDEYNAVQSIAREVQGPIICGFGRAKREDIDRAIAAIQDASRKRIHLFISSSDIHLTHQLRMNRRTVLEIARTMVAYAKEHVEDIEFSAMDASRTDDDFLFELVEAAVSEGATTINIPDTVGFALPEQFGALIARLRQEVHGMDSVTVSVHCHDDLGLAVANSLAGVKCGARQVECTINGLGERAGNAALEEVVMAIHARTDYFAGLTTGVRTRHLNEVSRLVSEITSFHVPPNKAIVGQNAFRHESGIHQDGVLKERKTYEILDPGSVGASDDNVVLGKHSGRHAFKSRLERLGIWLEPAHLDEAFSAFKRLADTREIVADEEIAAIAKQWHG